LAWQLLIREVMSNIALQGVVDLVAWKRHYQAKLPIGGKVAGFAPGN
jgi:hypothetical protein